MRIKDNCPMARRNTQAGFASGLTPYSQAERDRDRESAARGQRTAFVRRQSLQSGQRYDQSGTAESRAKDLRILGEKPEA
jgi:hypothetical protein